MTTPPRPRNRAEQRMLDQIGRKYVCPNCRTRAQRVERDGWHDWEVKHRPDCSELDDLETEGRR